MQYTQQEIANFTLLKDAFLQRNQLYDDEEALYELVRQTPKVLLMQYTEYGNKYILIAMLKKGIYEVVDHIKNGDVDPFEAVSLRGIGQHSRFGIFSFGITDESGMPEFNQKIFSIYHETSEFGDGDVDTFRNACVRQFQVLRYFVGDMYDLLETEETADQNWQKFNLSAFQYFHTFLSRDNFDVIRRLKSLDGDIDDPRRNTILRLIRISILHIQELISDVQEEMSLDDNDTEFLNKIGLEVEGILFALSFDTMSISDMSTSEDEPQASDQEDSLLLSDGEEQYLFQTLDIQAELGVTYSLRDFRRYTLPDTKLVMEINDEDCDVGDVDTKKEYPVKINVSENGVEWDRQGTSADAKLYIFCASDLKNWLNTHTGYNTFGEDSVYLENQALHDKNPFNNKTIYGVEYLTQEEIDQEMQKYDTAEDTSDYQSQLQNQISDLQRQIDDLARQIEQMDTDKNSLDRRKRFLEIQLRQKQATLNIMRQPTSIKLKL